VAIAPPTDLASFRLGDFTLEARAPEELRFGVKAMMRYFFYKKGPTVVQKGRVMPKPVTLQFRYHGPDALDAFLFWKTASEKQLPIKFSWANRFAYNGYLEEVEGSASQRLVTGTLTYQPTSDSLAHNNTGAVTAGFNNDPSINAELVAAAMDLIPATTFSLNALANQLKGMVNASLGSLYDAINGVNNAIDDVAAAISTFGDVLSIPFQTAASLVDTLNSAIALFPAAYGTLNANVLAPLVPVLTGTADYLSKALGLSASGLLNDIQDNTLVLMEAIQPLTLPYVVQFGDTLQAIADLWGVAITSILQANSGLATGNVATYAGKTIQIPLDG
jgi:LysM repeat protein